MSKLAATTIFNCRTHIGRLCLAWSALALLPAPVAAEPVPDPTLKLSEQLDTNRIGKVSDDERSVLRIEWRAGMMGVEEGHSVAHMLLKLERMEQTVAEVTRLVRDMPVQKPLAAVVAAEPAKTDDHGLRLVVANVAAAGLVGLWWFRRRKSAKSPKTNAALDTSPAPKLPRPVAPDKTSPTTPRTDKPTSATVSAPQPKPPVLAPPPKPLSEAPQPRPTDLEPTAKPPREATPIQPKAPAEQTKTTPAPAKITQPDRGLENVPKLADAEPYTPPPPAQITVIDFQLDEPQPKAAPSAQAEIPRPPAGDDLTAPGVENNGDPSLELANIMLSMGLTENATQALIDYAEANPRQALYHWLKLLDIYGKNGSSHNFKETAEKLRQNFNIQAEDWAKANTGEVPTLESFTHVSQLIQKAWSLPKDCIHYLQHLLEDNREGLRTGFPLPVAEEILLLIEIQKDISGVYQATVTQRLTR